MTRAAFVCLLFVFCFLILFVCSLFVRGCGVVVCSVVVVAAAVVLFLLLLLSRNMNNE